PALLAARMGVAVGEAGCSPASMSLLADYYPPNRRAFVMAVMQAGGTVGLGVALLFGGMLAEAYGWRAPIIMIGVLGLLLAIPAWRYRPEPRRAASARGEIESHAMPLAQALRFMLGQPA